MRRTSSLDRFRFEDRFDLGGICCLVDGKKRGCTQCKTGRSMEEPSDAERMLMTEIESMLQEMKWPSRVTRKNIGSDPNRKAFALGKV